jgi:hypothetical protein
VFRYWLQLGIKMGWISKPYCMTHDGNYEYMTEEERKEWDDGGDPSIQPINKKAPQIKSANCGAFLFIG